MTADTTDQTPPRSEGPQRSSERGDRGAGRIGLLGGTFDPPHLGHLIVGEQVRSACALDEVWFVVANDPWQKSDREVTAAVLRSAMTAAAIGDTPGFAVSEVEIGRGGPSYTVDTIAELRSLHPETDFSLILGRDAAAGLATWERPEELASAAEVLVVERPGWSDPIPAGFRWRSVESPLIDISSTDLRRRVAEGRSIRFLVPDAVRTMIESQGIYRRAE